MGKIGKIYAFYVVAKNIAFFRNVLLRYGQIPIKRGRLLKPHFFGTFHYALAEDTVKRCGCRKDTRMHEKLTSEVELFGPFCSTKYYWFSRYKVVKNAPAELKLNLNT